MKSTFPCPPLITTHLAHFALARQPHFQPSMDATGPPQLGSPKDKPKDLRQRGLSDPVLFKLNEVVLSLSPTKENAEIHDAPTVPSYHNTYDSKHLSDIGWLCCTNDTNTSSLWFDNFPYSGQSATTFLEPRADAFEGVDWDPLVNAGFFPPSSPPPPLSFELDSQVAFDLTPPIFKANLESQAEFFATDLEFGTPPASGFVSSTQAIIDSGICAELDFSVTLGHGHVDTETQQPIESRSPCDENHTTSSSLLEGPLKHLSAQANATAFSPFSLSTPGPTKPNISQQPRKNSSTAFRCERGCSKSFPSRKDLVRHHKTQAHRHGETTLYRCRCGYSTPRKDHYRRHLRQISDKRPCGSQQPYFRCICRLQTAQDDVQAHLKHINACKEGTGAPGRRKKIQGPTVWKPREGSRSTTPEAK
ncbi:hypothetical protein CT0861_00396 [Colletotrichum tofieldiae]|uniref:C2H2-type domain-containing protein n=1 Tax=Colletotrichum tofieldiae TaxID=708197 RepID=A0A166MBC5_9PEZI|nr:hypothetical protein CT0861_00396 [Colletotrichum tofieldiae]